MKKVSVIVILIVAFSLFTGQAAFAAGNREEAADPKDQVILRLLFYPALEAVEKHYGQFRQFWREKLVSIRKVPDRPDYEVVIQVETFQGPHNPPYGLETITFYIRYGQVELKSFEHLDE